MYLVFVIFFLTYGRFVCVRVNLWEFLCILYVFCRTTCVCCIARTMLRQDVCVSACLSVCLSVCQIVTRRYSVEMVTHWVIIVIIQLFHHRVATPVSLYQMVWQYSNWNPPPLTSAASNTRRYKNRNFRPVSCFIYMKQEVKVI